MKTRRILTLLVMFTLLPGVAACKTSSVEPVTPETTMQPLSPPTQIPNTEVPPSPTTEPTYQITSTPVSAEPSLFTQYQMDISLNYPNHSLMVSQVIDYTNNTGAELTELPLLVPPAVHPNVFSLISLQFDPAYLESTSDMEGLTIQLQLKPGLPPGKTFELNLIYELRLTEKRSAFGFTERQILLADWYPYVPPYLDDRGWLTNEPGEVGEYLTYPLADFTVNLHLSPPMENLIVAASSPLTSQEGNCLRYHAQNVRNFSLAISPDYQVTTTSNEYVTVKAYNFPEHANQGERAAELAVQAWELYINLYGGNQRQFLSVVEAEIEDGLECDGQFYLSDWYFESADETPKNYFELLVVHETAHQWFYALIPNDQANEPWLDEALATYSELLFLESFHPELVDWWWGFRVHAYHPTGAVNSTIYDYRDDRPYINAVYLRGATFLQDVREAVGDPAFYTFLQHYAQNNKEDQFRNSDIFFSLLSQTSDVDLSNLLTFFFR